MTKRAAVPCRNRACKDFAVKGGYCAAHQSQARVYDHSRGTAHQRGYDAQWRKARADYLAQHPLCCNCKSEGCIVAANVVDHIIPHKGDSVLFWDVSNWQALCEPCHNRKTATHDRGAWSHRKPKPIIEQAFEVGDVVQAATEYMQQTLDCDQHEQFTVTAVDGHTIQISNGLDGGTFHQKHFTHYTGA